MSNESLGITLHQLKIFWTVAQASSFTKASKILGLAQPSLSQQISKLEDEVGSLLFKRGRSQMSLTEAGSYLQRRAEILLSGIEETMVGLRQFGAGQKGLISVGLLSSVARNLLPSAAGNLAEKIPDIELNILEIAPAEAIDLLYGRQLSVAVLAEDSIAKSIVSFKKTNLFTDPYVLAVPKNINLENIKSFEDIKKPEDKVTLNNFIQFEFGNKHKKRIEEWFINILPNSKIFAKTRTYEVALSMVQSGRGVAVVPALAAKLGGQKVDFDVNLYRTNLPERNIISLIPSQYYRVEPYRTFIESLEEAGKKMKLPKIYNVPPILETLE